MTLAERCLARPVATMLFWIAVIAAGAVCWSRLPIAALPTYDTPNIEVKAKLPGASPENVASSVATPLEKEFSSIPGLVASHSENVQGESAIQLEFDASRDIDAAAADVQAALFRVTRSLPAELPAPPSYSKVNPGDAPILKLALSSPSLSAAELNAYIDELIVPALSAVKGVAQVSAKGNKRYAVRVHVDPQRLAALDLALTDVAAALQTANSNTALGQLDNPRQTLKLAMDGDLLRAEDFAAVIIATRGTQTVRLADVAQVLDSVEDDKNLSDVDGRPAVLIEIKRQPDANTVSTVDAVLALLPQLQAQMPGAVSMRALGDRSGSIRDAIHDVHLTLLLTIALVVLVILLFLRRFTATLIPSLAIPISLLGTFALMQALGLSLNNISLMGLTIAVGLVVDDAIVVLENIVRRIEHGDAPALAAREGTREVASTVLSISICLVAVFVPVFLLPGTMGLLFHDFALVVSVSVLVSALVSLTLIPVLVPMLLRDAAAAHAKPAPRWSRAFDNVFERLTSFYTRLLARALAKPAMVLAVGVATVLLTVLLYLVAPKTFFPQEDIGQVSVKLTAPADMSFDARLAALRTVQAVLLDDPAVAALASKVDHDSTKFDIDLKPRGERDTMPEVIARMRRATDIVPGVRIGFSPVQNLKVGSNDSGGSHAYTLQSVGNEGLEDWAQKLAAELRRSPVFGSIETDVDSSGLAAGIALDRDRMATLGVDMAAVRTTLHSAFGGRSVSEIHAPQATYKVILELDQQQRRDETDLARIHVRSADGALVPLTAFARVERNRGTTRVLHKSQLPAVTLAFELADGHSLSEAADAFAAARQALAMPPTLFGSFEGQAALYQQSQSSQLWLVALAVALLYVILGMLYESWVHPLTILLGLPSATFGAFLALWMARLEVSFIAMIGLLLLIGIVLKNAIMLVDVALQRQRGDGLDAVQAMCDAGRLRLRPILMTTACALVGALPIALGIGAGAELRQPLGVAIVGGLIVSQLTTLFVTPCVYVGFDRLARVLRRAALPRLDAVTSASHRSSGDGGGPATQAE